MNHRFVVTLILLTSLAACQGGRTEFTGRGADEPAPAADANEMPASLQACLAQPAGPACTAAIFQIAPAEFLAAAQQCPPDESGFNCLFNAAFDHLGGVEIAALINAVADACLGDPTAACSAVNDALPDVLPVLSLPVVRGELQREAAAAVAPSLKVVDGAIEDWTGQASGIGGAQHFSAGEHIYTDYLYDAFGADDGDDWRRLQLLGPLIEVQARARRPDQLMQAAGDQLDVPRPLGANDRYGDAEQADGTDLHELRWALQGDRLHLLVRFSRLTDPAQARLLLLAATGTGGEGEAREIPGSGLQSAVFDRAIQLSAAGAQGVDLISGNALPLDAAVAVNAAGFVNALEASFELSALSQGEVLQLALLSLDAEGRPANLAYRFDEPVAGIYNEQRQAMALYQGNVDAFAVSIPLAELAAGRNEQLAPGPGYHERQFASSDNIAVESGELARAQRYGLYVPDTYAGEPTPISYWMHYRGGKAHSGAAWTPRLITELGSLPGHIVATPHGRGTSSWYTTDAHQDLFEVMADVESLLAVDPRRRYLSGYSMGGYATYLFGLLYPDLFAAGYSTSGAPTQGAWTGVGPDAEPCRAEQFEIPELGDGNLCFIQANEGDADAQLNFRILENARHFPLSIHHGTDDELVPPPGIQRFGLRLLELGYRYDLLSFIGYEHFSQAIVDEWAEGARYMHAFVSPENPRTVTYKLVPALIDAVNTVKPDPAEARFDFSPDGAYWVDGLVVAGVDPENPRDPSIWGMIEAESQALAGDTVVTVPRGGVINAGSDGVTVNPGTPLVAAGHSTPFLRHGQDWIATGETVLANAFSVTATNLSAAALDLARMGLDQTQRFEGSITTEHALALSLRHADAGLAVQLDGAAVTAVRDGDALIVTIPAGSHALALEPAR